MSSKNNDSDNWQHASSSQKSRHQKEGNPLVKNLNQSQSSSECKSIESNGSEIKTSQPSEKSEKSEKWVYKSRYESELPMKAEISIKGRATLQSAHSNFKSNTQGLENRKKQNSSFPSKDSLSETYPPKN